MSSRQNFAQASGDLQNRHPTESYATHTHTRAYRAWRRPPRSETPSGCIAPSPRARTCSSRRCREPTVTARTAAHSRTTRTPRTPGMENWIPTHNASAVLGGSQDPDSTRSKRHCPPTPRVALGATGDAAETSTKDRHESERESSGRAAKHANCTSSNHVGGDPGQTSVQHRPNIGQNIGSGPPVGKYIGILIDPRSTG